MLTLCSQITTPSAHRLVTKVALLPSDLGKGTKGWAPRSLRDCSFVSLSFLRSSRHPPGCQAYQPRAFLSRPLSRVFVGQCQRTLWTHPAEAALKYTPRNIRAREFVMIPFMATERVPSSGPPPTGGGKTDGTHPVQFYDHLKGAEQFHKDRLGPEAGRAANPPAETGHYQNPPISEWGPPSVSGQPSAGNPSGWAPGTDTQGYGQARRRT